MGELRYGASVAAQEAVVDWLSVGSTFKVRTTRHEYEATALVDDTTGPWAAQMLANFCRCRRSKW